MNTSTVTAPSRRAWPVFVAFPRLGLTSFGGPVAHLDYFRDAFVALVFVFWRVPPWAVVIASAAPGWLSPTIA